MNLFIMVKRFFLHFIFNIFNTLPNAVNFGIPSSLALKKVENSFAIKILLKFYMNDVEIFLKNDYSKSLVVNKNIFIVAYDNTLSFYDFNFGLEYVTTYRLEYSIENLIEIDNKLILCWGIRSIKFSDKNYFISFKYITLLDISNINKIKKLFEIKDSNIKINTIIKIDNSILAASINNFIVLFDIADKSNMRVLSKYKTKYAQKELILINKYELLCNEDLLRLDISNPRDIKLIEVNYSMAYNSDLINIENKRIFYCEYYERGGNSFVIDNLPSYNNISRYINTYSFNSIILFNVNIIALLSENLILLDISNEKELIKVSEFSLKKYKNSKYNFNNPYIIKGDKDTLFYVNRPNIIVLKVLENYIIEEINSYTFENYSQNNTPENESPLSYS